MSCIPIESYGTLDLHHDFSLTQVNNPAFRIWSRVLRTLAATRRPGTFGLVLQTVFFSLLVDRDNFRVWGSEVSCLDLTHFWPMFQLFGPKGLISYPRPLKWEYVADIYTEYPWETTWVDNKPGTMFLCHFSTPNCIVRLHHNLKGTTFRMQPQADWSITGV